MVDRVLTALSLAIWFYLAFGNGRFWRTSVTLPLGTEPTRWPSVTVVIPARNEADVLPRTLPTLVGQDYRGSYRVLVVDDASSDGTAAIAERFGATVVRTDGPPPGWAGKVAAMAAGVDAAGSSEYLFFTDADIAHPVDAVNRLVSAACSRNLVLTSQMVRLRTQTRWEKLLVPAFVWFFAQLYPFARVNSSGRTAAAAGGCMLVHRETLRAAGGLAGIADAVIDDVALARLMKRAGPIWLGLSAEMRSVRPYPRLRDLWQMISRSAYTQLRYSLTLVLITLVALLLTYVWPPVAVLIGASVGDSWVLAGGALCWFIMCATYLPILRFYRLRAYWAPALPAVAVLYAAMTADSARCHFAGRGAAWKGRTASPRER